MSVPLVVLVIRTNGAIIAALWLALVNLSSIAIDFPDSGNHGNCVATVNYCYMIPSPVEMKEVPQNDPSCTDGEGMQCQACLKMQGTGYCRFSKNRECHSTILVFSAKEVGGEKVVSGGCIRQEDRNAVCSGANINTPNLSMVVTAKYISKFEKCSSAPHQRTSALLLLLAIGFSLDVLRMF